MDAVKELQRLQVELAKSLQAQASAEASATKAVSAYEQALADWEAKNPELVEAKNIALSKKTEAKKHVEVLREEARKLLIERMLDNLPDGFNQKRSKTVIYDKQSLRAQALAHFHHLLELNDAWVQKFFINEAEEADDGALILPEHIRSLAAVEVVYKPKPEISDAKLSKLVFEDKSPEETEPLTMIVKVEPQPWKRPANFEALLTAPELPIIQNFSPEGESLPMNSAFNDDGTWRNPAMWDTEEDEHGDFDAVAADKRLEKHFAVPPTEDIKF
jgi:hypothetical protein